MIMKQPTSILFFVLFITLAESFAAAPSRGWFGRGGSLQSPTVRSVLHEPQQTNGQQMRKQATINNSNNKPVEYVAETKLPTDLGPFQLRAYKVPGSPLEPCVIYSRHPGSVGTSKVPVRIHDQCLTSEVFRSQRCDCKEQLYMSLKYIQENGGCIIYLQQEGRGIGLANKVAAYALQDGGLDTVDANLHLGFPEDQREYDVVPGILEDMGIDSIQLMTNNPRKVEMLEKHGVQVDNTIPMVVPEVNPYNRQYLETKVKRMDHQHMGNLLMVPRRSLQNKHLTNGTDMTANAVQVSVSMVGKDMVDADAGVKAAEDGYCFGKQSVIDAIDAVRRGEMVIVVDDMDRENEGDFIMAAECCTPSDMAQVVRYSSGVVCVALEEERMDDLEIPPMTKTNQDPKGTAFGVSIDAKGCTTGISATDRAMTVNMLADPKVGASAFNRPGHIFPLKARKGGVLTRDGHTEAAVDLSRLAGWRPAGVLCEIVSEEEPTEMMRLPEIKRFCKRHGYVLTSIADMAQYRRETER